MSSCHALKVSDTFGQVQLVAHDQAVLIDIDSRNYDTTGHLHVDHAHLRLPVAIAYRLHALLAEAIVAAEESDPRQPGLWGGDNRATNARASRAV